MADYDPRTRVGGELYDPEVGERMNAADDAIEHVKARKAAERLAAHPTPFQRLTSLFTRAKEMRMEDADINDWWNSAELAHQAMAILGIPEADHPTFDPTAGHTWDGPVDRAFKQGQSAGRVEADALKAPGRTFIVVPDGVDYAPPPGTYVSRVESVAGGYRKLTLDPDRDRQAYNYAAATISPEFARALAPNHPDQPARPVEDREPVGPYAPTRDGQFIGNHEGGRWVLTQREYTALQRSGECKIDHQAVADQAFERGRQQGDADRAERGHSEFQRGYASGVAIGKSEREAELLDQGWTPPGAVVDLVSNGLRSTVGAVASGLDAADQMGSPVPSNVVDGIIKAAIPYLAGAYIAAPEASAFQHPHPQHRLVRQYLDSVAPVGQAWPVSTDRMADTLCLIVDSMKDAIRTEASAVHTLEVTSGPTDYEVWRDALTLASRYRHATEGDLDEVESDAGWFWELLQQVPVQKGDDPDDALAETPAAADLDEPPY